MMSTRLVNGKAETIDICPRCFWLEKFRAEGENGKALREGIERELLPKSGRTINSLTRM